MNKFGIDGPANPNKPDELPNDKITIKAPSGSDTGNVPDTGNC